MRYFSEHADKVYAILNCKQRKHDDDAMITMPLGTREFSLYEEMKSEGMEDSKIFQTLFPTKLPSDSQTDKVQISVGELNKRQLIVLITEELGTSLPTLTRMSTEDLTNLLLGIGKKKRSR